LGSASPPRASYLHRQQVTRSSGQTDTFGYNTTHDMVMAAVTSGTHTMTVDAAGNRQTENFGAEAVDDRYDADHRLTEVVFADGSQLQRAFDPVGRCVQEAWIPASGPSVVRRWYFDGASPTLEVTVADGVNGVQESLAALNVFSIEGAAPLLIHHFSQGVSTDTSWSLTDTSGWVRALMDDQGNLVQHSTYDSEFGLVTGHAGAASQATPLSQLPVAWPYLYKGLRLLGADVLHGKTLYQAGARIFDADTASYLTRSFPGGGGGTAKFDTPNSTLSAIDGETSPFNGPGGAAGGRGIPVMPSPSPSKKGNFGRLVKVRWFYGPAGAPDWRRIWIHIPGFPGIGGSGGWGSLGGGPSQSGGPGFQQIWGTPSTPPFPVLDIWALRPIGSKGTGDPPGGPTNPRKAKGMPSTGRTYGTRGFPSTGYGSYVGDEVTPTGVVLLSDLVAKWRDHPGRCIKCHGFMADVERLGSLLVYDERGYAAGRDYFREKSYTAVDLARDAGPPLALAAAPLLLSAAPSLFAAASTEAALIEDGIEQESALIESEVAVTESVEVVETTEATSAAREIESFFANTRYTSKVLEQMSWGHGEFHSFPETVRAFEEVGTVTTLTDGATRLSIPGSYATSNGNWYNGAFVFIKDVYGMINQRFFEIL